jgi:enamine deaminase RidA (YjgF/YER057c/UK114 family)
MKSDTVETFLHTTNCGGITESCLGIQHVGGADALSIFQGFPHPGNDVAAQWVFGGCQFHDAGQAAMGHPRWPMMWLQGDPCDGTHLAGFQAVMLKGAKVRSLTLDGRVVGTAWSDADADYCWLAGVMPSDISASRGAQTRQVYERIESLLKQVDLSFLDVVRTWLYLDQLLDWYGEFNRARDQFLQERDVFKNRVPASTGIGARNPGGAAILAGALAVRPKHAGVKITVVPSPFQCSALEYRSSFSRAMELEFPSRRQLIISGTASIAPGGESMHRDDTSAQIDLTMKVVEAILESRGMSWSDVTRAIGYFQNMREAPLLADYCRKRGILKFPVVNAHATVCRHDLLFEIELDAAVVR